jgi:subtilisin family serine protease
MKRKALFAFLIFFGLGVLPAGAENRFIVRSNLGTEELSQVCGVLGCKVAGNLDGTLNQLFLLTTPDTFDPNIFLFILRFVPGVADAELDQVVSLGSGLNQMTVAPSGLTDNAPVNYFGETVWNGYATQPAAQIVRVAEAQSTFQVAGAAIIADIDTGVDPNHPALQPVLLPGYDFTRNQPNGSEMTDFTGPPPPANSANVAQVNQSTAAVLDQSTAAVLDGNVQYAAFGHGTMVMGVIHLVAPKSRLLPLKAFHSDGTGFLSDILRAIYYGVQNNARVINMSFDTTTSSTELKKALDYANQSGVISVASAGNDGQPAPPHFVYPAALQSDVMGVASTTDLGGRSSFSDYGDAIVWVAAPGEDIISTYPFGTYAAGSGTSFSAPFVSGTCGLLLQLSPSAHQSQAAIAVAHAVPAGASMGNGRLDVVQTLQSLSKDQE